VPSIVDAICARLERACADLFAALEAARTARK